MGFQKLALQASGANAVALGGMSMMGGIPMMGMMPGIGNGLSPMETATNVVALTQVSASHKLNIYNGSVYELTRIVCCHTALNWNGVH